MSDGALERRFHIGDMIAYAEKVLAYNRGTAPSIPVGLCGARLI